ncbi:MAG TPA: pitrilysin family protein [Anaeromyxobacteraceae bacterium]|nr:pitrilysin family protein [Anaeromyxobacteraceae bacterium]
MIRRIATAALVLLGLAACATARAPAPAPPAAAAPDRTRLPERGPPPELRLPAQRHFVLANGLRVRLVEYGRLPIVALELVVDAGGLHDPADRPGLASLTADMMNEGTRTRSATRISDEVGFIGATLSAAAGFDSATLVGASLTRHLPKLAELFADVAMNPSFPEADFRRVQDERLVSLLQQRDQPHTVAAKAFAEVFWGEHPYGHWLAGTEGSVKAMRRRDLAEFHARRWTPAGAELVVVGDVKEADLRALLEPTLGRWTAGQPGAPPVAAPPRGQPRTVAIEKAGAPQAQLQLGMPGVPRSSPDHVAAEVVFQVLAGGTSSRVFRNIREAKGYTYGIGGRSDARRLGGSSVLGGSVKADRTGEAIRDILEEVRRLREEPVPPGEMEDAKAALVLGLPAGFATAGGIAGHLAELVVHGLPDDHWNRYVDQVQAVTAEDVRRVARQILDPARVTLVVVGDAAVVRPQLQGLPIGPVELRPAR